MTPYQNLAGQEGIEINLAGDPSQAEISMDVNRITQVISNLLDNAIRHTPRGGHIDVQIRPAPGGIEFCIQDSGLGVAPDDLSRLFDRFYRAEQDRDRATGGTGLGLSIAKSIIESHGGHIQVASEVGKGLKVIFFLPDGSS